MDITYRLAISKQEQEQAAAIVRKQYQQSGYASEGTMLDEKIIPFLNQHTSKTFFAQYVDTALATVSVIEDSPLGLPLDELYKEEIDSLRKQGKKLAEVSQLALDSTFVQELFGEKTMKKNTLILPLFKLVLHHCLAQKIDTLCIAINPKHEVFYDALGFRTVGGLRYYVSFNGAPALAKALDLGTLGTLEARNKFLYNTIVLSPPDAKVLTGESSFHFTS